MRLTRPLFILLRDAARVRGVPTGGTETASEQTRARRVAGEPPKRGKEETIDGWVPRAGRAEGVGSSLDDDDDVVSIASSAVRPRGPTVGVRARGVESRRRRRRKRRARRRRLREREEWRTTRERGASTTQARVETAAQSVGRDETRRGDRSRRSRGDDVGRALDARARRRRRRNGGTRHRRASSRANAAADRHRASGHGKRSRARARMERRRVGRRAVIRRAQIGVDAPSRRRRRRARAPCACRGRRS